MNGGRNAGNFHVEKSEKKAIKLRNPSKISLWPIYVIAAELGSFQILIGHSYPKGANSDLDEVSRKFQGRRSGENYWRGLVDESYEWLYTRISSGSIPPRIFDLEVSEKFTISLLALNQIQCPKQIQNL